MADVVTWKVKIPTLGKTPIEVEATDPVSAVNAIVTDLAKRTGDRVDVMAGRLDRFAEVKEKNGAPVTVSIREACPALTSFEQDIAEGLAQEISSSFSS